LPLVFSDGLVGSEHLRRAYYEGPHIRAMSPIFLNIRLRA